MTTYADFAAARAAAEMPPPLLDLPREKLLLSYQGGCLAACGTHALMVFDKSRRIGFTWGVLAPYAVRKAASARGQGGSDVMYISYSFDMTREFMDACAMWAKAFAMTIAAIDNDYIFEDQDEHGNSRQIKGTRIQFASGFEIIALSSAPRSIRGKQGVVMIDEAAFVDNLDELLKAALALLMWGGQVIVVSTHNGADNPFNELLGDVDAGRRRGGHRTITFDDAIAAGLFERVKLVTNTPLTKEQWIAEVRGSYTEDQAREELDCIPSQGAGSLIPMEKIVACLHPDAGKPELYAKGATTLGRDVAIRKDLAVIHATEIVATTLWLRERWMARKATFAEQDAQFDRMMAAYRVVRAKIDQTGMGEKVVEDTHRKYGDVVEGVIFSGPRRLDLGLGLLKRFEDETIRIPNDKALIADLRAIKKKKGTGNVPQLVETGSLHADEFWALALAVDGAGTDPIAYRGYQGIERTASIFSGRDGDDDGQFHMRADQRSSNALFGTGTF